MDDQYDYLIIGGGMVADAAAKGIREVDETGSIGILGREDDAPFPRPALSKKLWTDPDFGFDDAALGTEDETGARVHVGTEVVSLDRAGRTVATSAGQTFGYGSLLLATGSSPHQVEGLPPGERVLYFRTVQDYHRLREIAGSRPHVVVVGGGYIGAEIATALIQNECRVTLLHTGTTLGDSTFPAPLADRFQRLFTDRGVTVRGGAKVTGGTVDDDDVVITVDGGEPVRADAVVLGLGVRPNGRLAADAGLQTTDDGGIVVDEHLRTADPQVHAAGDVAQYPDAILGRRRVEHVDNADEMGASVGRIMAGSPETYDHTPYYYSEVFGVRYEAVGTLDGSLETIVEDGADGRAVVYYRDSDRTVGVLLWKLDDARDAARDVLANPDRDPSGSIDPDGVAQDRDGG